MDVRHCNHAGTSFPKPPGVARAVAETIEAAPGQRNATYERVLEQCAEAFGIPGSDRLRVTGSCTAALDVLIGDLPWSAGDVVLTSALEHHALIRPIARLVRDRGVVHRVAPYVPGAAVDLSWMRAQLQAGGVRLVAHTAASNVTGELLPTAELVVLAHEFGALHLTDAAQTAGIVPLDVLELGTDMLAVAGHKGPLGPLGAGLAWAAPQVEFATPALEGPLGVDRGRPFACIEFPGWCDLGSVNMGAVAGLGAALEWSVERGGALVLGARAQAMARELAGRLAELLGTLEAAHELLGGGVDTPRTGAVGITAPPAKLAAAEAFFAERGVAVRAGRHCAVLALETLGVDHGTLRISFGGTSQDDDLEVVWDVLREWVRS